MQLEPSCLRLRAGPRVLLSNLGREGWRWLRDREKSSWVSPEGPHAKLLWWPNCRRCLESTWSAIECARLPRSCSVEQGKEAHAQQEKDKLLGTSPCCNLYEWTKIAPHNRNWKNQHSEKIRQRTKKTLRTLFEKLR